MNRPTHSFLLVDDLDLHLHGKPLKQSIETYAGYALSEVYKRDFKKSEDYLIRLLICLRGNTDL